MIVVAVGTGEMIELERQLAVDENASVARDLDLAPAEIPGRDMAAGIAQDLDAVEQGGHEIEIFLVEEPPPASSS